ncbi:MAG TPA: electron transporter RnfC, partial [bacterium]|nr:electron transporter RnfC [bacterium]
MISGGVHPLSFKRLSRNFPIQEFLQPERVVLPLSQHTGAAATPVVKKGDEVVQGQLIGQANGFVSSCLHASISGRVSSVDYCYLPSGRRSLAITI